LQYGGLTIAQLSTYLHASTSQISQALSVAKQYLNQFIKLFGDKMPDTQPAMEVRA
jgi:hypothetical protein